MGRIVGNADISNRISIRDIGEKPAQLKGSDSIFAFCFFSPPYAVFRIVPDIGREPRFFAAIASKTVLIRVLLNVVCMT